MNQERIIIQYEEHLQVLIDRIVACTEDEKRVIAKVLAQNNPDILFVALMSEMDRRGKKIANFESAFLGKEEV